MKHIAILVAATMLLAMAAGCATTIPQKTVPAVVKPKACR